MKILITGGAGFVGSNLAIHLKNNLECEVVAMDNLHRRGSELSLPRLKENGVTFRHGDIRIRSDFASLPNIDAAIDCSAEPSVLAGMDGCTDYVMNTNLVGTLNCLEHARTSHAQFIFLSTSRVYPTDALNRIRYKEGSSRFELERDQSIPGLSEHGISEALSTRGPRTLYGTSKLASELLVEEYGHSFNMPTAINRCGVIAGAWQMGKIDQGVAALWVASHIFKRPLSYIGFGGEGKQVRDVLHIDDLADLILEQIKNQDTYNGAINNVGGGTDCSFSLRELTSLCETATGNTIDISSTAENRQGDIPVYISDCRKLFKTSFWRPQKKPADIIDDISTWIHQNKESLKHILA